MKQKQKMKTSEANVVVRTALLHFMQTKADLSTTFQLSHVELRNTAI